MNRPLLNATKPSTHIFSIASYFTDLAARPAGCLPSAWETNISSLFFSLP